jgi:Pvc16 N-terminal domain
MSNALAIAATTATLRELLLKAKDLAGVANLDVTTQPLDVASESESTAQLNLFLYQTVVNGGWRNLDMPRQVRPGETAAPPLSLNLHYLITAYGRDVGSDKDVLSDRLLGAAMSLLHDHSVLSRNEIVEVHEPSGLADQFERLRITPLPMGVEDMSKLWTIFQTEYRISAAYEVTVVLIDSRRSPPSPLPVLKRGKEDRGPTAVVGGAPNLREIRLPRSQSAASLGEEITIVGGQLTTDATKVRFKNLREKDPISLDPAAGATPDEIAVGIPNAAQDVLDWTPGFYTIALVQQRSDMPIVSNELAFALAPRITVTPTSATLSPLPVQKEDLTFDLTCEPNVLPSQRIVLLFGGRQITVPAVAGPTTKLKITVPNVERGKYVVRLRVDGVDSIPVKYQGSPPIPEFEPAQTVMVT